MRLSRGFTLGELLVTIAILSIFATMAAPAYQSVIASTKVTDTADFLSQMLAYAKSEAVNLNQDVYLTINNSSDQSVCVSSTSTASCDIRDELIAGGVTIAMTDTSGTEATKVIFSGAGTPTPSITNFSITDGTSTQTIVLNVLGLVTKG